MASDAQLRRAARDERVAASEALPDATAIELAAAATDPTARDGDAADRSAESTVGGWPMWRGPGRDGHARDARLPEPWPAGDLEPEWRYELGTGWSSPIVADGRVFITDRRGDEERVVALDLRTGSFLWEHGHPVDFDPHAVGRRHGNGPKATPCFASGRVYSLGIAGWLECLDAASGHATWTIHLPAKYGERETLRDGRAFVNGTENVIVPVGDGQGAPVPLFGYTGSPLVHRGLLVCAVGGARGGTIMAFDAATGNERWRALHENVAYSSPIVAKLGGIEQVVVMTGPSVVGLCLDDGQLLWRHPFQIQYDESISTPAVAGNLVIVTGDGKPLTALRIESRGEQLSVEVAWKNFVLSSYLSSMLVDGEYLYGMNDTGEFVCVRISDGETVWAGGNHGFYSTPVLCGDRLLALNEEGALVILRATPQHYQLLASCQLSQSATWTSPAVVEAQIVVRTETDIRCFDFGAE